MSVAQKVVAIFMTLIIIQTIVEYCFFWEQFERRFGNEFKGLSCKLAFLKDILMLLYAVGYKTVKMVAILMVFISLLLIYAYGTAIIQYLELLFVYNYMRLGMYRRHRRRF